MGQWMSGLSIAFMTTSLTRGGAETQVTRVATRLSARGWTVRVISLLPPDAFEDELEHANVRVTSLDMTRGVPDPRALVKSIRLLRQWRPHVLTTYMVHANLLGRIAGWLARVPVIVSSVRNEWFGGRSWDRWLAATDWMATATVTNSSLVARELERRRAVGRNRLSVIPNGIALSSYARCEAHRSALRSQLRVGEADFLWLSAASLEPQKDHKNLLEAFRHVAAANPLVQLCIAGTGSQRQALEAHARSLRITERVRFLGLREDIPQLLSAADGLVLSSAWEGLPNIIMEALATSLPVVATRVGGVPELVRDGETGILTPPGDPLALARGMQQLAAMAESERRLLGEHGRAFVKQHLELEHVVDQWENLFRELLAR